MLLTPTQFVIQRRIGHPLAVVAHAFYDFVALVYLLRWTRPATEATATEEVPVTPD